MLKYTVKRLAQSLVTILLVATLVFLLMRCLPTDYYFTEEQLMKFTEEQKYAALEAAGLTDPIGTQLQSLTQAGTALTVFLSPGSNRMADISFTLAGACLAKTCFGLDDFSMVTIRSGDRDVSFRPDDLIFQDTSATLEDTQKEENP